MTKLVQALNDYRRMLIDQGRTLEARAVQRCIELVRQHSNRRTIKRRGDSKSPVQPV